MRSFSVVLLAFFISCQSVKIDDKNYHVSGSTTEIGSIGLTESFYPKNIFETRVLPRLENKIRVDIKIVPFTKRLYGLYYKKGKNNQNQATIHYVDSLPKKPELVTISILDVVGFIDEINADYNATTLAYLKTVKKAKVITSIATTLSGDQMAKIAQADTYYIANNQDKKYTLVLYKSNKKTEVIDLQSGIVIGYELGKCCWATDRKGQWFLADINKNNESCKGDSYTTITEKKAATNLYKM